MTTIARSARRMGACACAIRRASEVREKRSRASPDAYKRRASVGGKRTVWLRADDAARLGVRLGCAMASFSRLSGGCALELMQSPSSSCWLFRACDF